MQAPGDPQDAAMRERLEKADKAMRSLYLTLKASDAASTGAEDTSLNG